MQRPFLLFKRGRYWYYRLAEERTFHTTGQTIRVKAEAFVVELLRNHEGHSRQRHASFRQYADPFFIWDCCPQIRRLREEGKSITQRHAKIQRQRLIKHIFKDPFARKRLSEITRADVLDLRSRLLGKNAPATVNKALGIVKVIFREALYREEINRDPTAGVGRVKYRRVERGIFTLEELRTLFPDHGYGPWKDVQDYTCFYLAAVTGLRRGEILALRCHASTRWATCLGCLLSPRRFLQGQRGVERCIEKGLRGLGQKRRRYKHTDLAKTMLSIGAVKGIKFGAGFQASLHG